MSETKQSEMNKNSEASFVPVLLGTETAVYSIARAFHEAYGVTSLAYGVFPLVQTAHSRFIEVRCHEDFLEPDRFVEILNGEVPRMAGRKALVLSCGDHYTRLLSSVKDRLDPIYEAVCPDYDIVDAVNSKIRFYEFCEKAQIPYPATLVLEGPELPQHDFSYPLVLKPDDGNDFREHPFPGQQKAFILHEEAALRKALEDSYAAGYGGRMLLQEFIPGGDENMRVVNGYKRSDGKLALLSMGRPLLEDYSPMAIGNYMVILAEGDQRVYDTVEQLLEAIPYLGYFNLDLKYDSRSGEFKVFDFNPRMGRSSYYVTLAGHNLSRCVVEDLVEHKEAPLIRSTEEALWADIPASLIRKYVNPGEAKERALALLGTAKSGGTFRGAGDNDIHRRIEDLRRDLRNKRNYKRYFVQK